MLTNRILLVEDDPSIVEMVQSYLEKEGYKVTTAYNGEEGILKFKQQSYDLIILDIMMPKLGGMEVLRSIRDQSSIPVLMMSAKDSDVDKALGLGFGADDYLAKPFSMIEMLARIKAAIRRATEYAQPAIQQPQIIEVDELKVDISNFSVIKNQEDLKLTSKEFEILKLMITSPNRVFTKAQLYKLIWQEEYYGDENVINVHIRRLRGKIEDDPSNPKYIKTLWGIGYKWEG
jgi:DNA-binding response OmpR family regulator